MAKFHKSGKWRNKKNWFIKYLRKTYGSWIIFFCFPFRTKLIILLSLLWKILLNQNMKTLTSKKLKVLLKKIALFIRCYSSKERLVSSSTKRFEKTFAHEISIKSLWIHLQKTKISSTEDKIYNLHFLRNCLKSH